MKEERSEASLAIIKRRRTAAHLDRPGEDCKAAPGSFIPLVDRVRCEGKGDCVIVCPYDVFEVRRIEDEAFRLLPWLSRLKIAVHGMKSAYTPRADQCRACGYCIVSCPEHAIKLVSSVATSKSA